MKKILFLSLLATAFVMSAGVYSDMQTKARNYYRGGGFDGKFVGLELGALSLEGDTGKHGDDYNGHSVSLGIRLGAMSNAWRSMVMFDYHDSDSNDQSYERLMVEVDYFVQSKGMEQYAIRPYIGGNLGYLNYESTGIDHSGATFGGEAGVIVKLNSMLGLDFAYRYSLAIPDELDSIGQFVFAIDYSF